MTDDPLDAMKARWNHIQGYLFPWLLPWLREEVDPMTEALGRLVTTLDVIGLEAFVEAPDAALEPQRTLITTEREAGGYPRRRPR